MRQRLTFPFPFVHQQPHDCGNKTINRWETSLSSILYTLWVPSGLVIESGRRDYSQLGAPIIPLIIPPYSYY